MRIVPKTLSLLSITVGLMASPAFAADRTEQVGGWRLSDIGGKPGNDLDRDVAMVRKVSGAEISYKAGPGRSGTVSGKFDGCNGQSEYTASLEFKDSAHAIKSVREEIAYDFAEFRKECAAVTVETEKSAMEGFDKALETLLQWVKDRPFVYPPNEAPAAPAPDSGGKMAPEDMT